MRPLVLTMAALIAAACGPALEPKLPPSNAFYYPTGIAHADAAASGEGFLYVASSNFDKRFDFGAVTAVDLGALIGAGLPALGAPATSEGPVEITDLKVGEAGVASIESFAGEMAAFALPDGGARLFVPSRAEGHFLQAIDAAGPALSAPNAASLVAFEDTEAGVPRAPEPMGVALSQDGEVFVTHIEPADSPAGSGKDPQTYLVRLSAQEPVVTEESFIPLGGDPTHAVAVGSRYAFVTGRIPPPGNQIFSSLLRLVERGTGRVISPGVESAFQVREGRGIALSPDERRVYVAARGPDALVVLDVLGADGPSPSLEVVGAVPLPAEASQVKVIARVGRGNLVVVTCASGMVAVYDDEVGELVAQIPTPGAQPFGIAVDERGSGARIFVTLFSDGRVGVIDIPDLLRPHEARLVALLGPRQGCVVDPSQPSCQEAQ